MTDDSQLLICSSAVVTVSNRGELVELQVVYFDKRVTFRFNRDETLALSDLLLARVLHRLPFDQDENARRTWQLYLDLLRFAQGMFLLMGACAIALAIFAWLVPHPVLAFASLAVGLLTSWSSLFHGRLRKKMIRERGT